MRRHSRKGLTVRLASLVIIFFLYICMLPVVPRTSTHAQGGVRPEITVIAPGAAYRQTNFVSDIPGLGFIQDPLLVNPWGITTSASSPFWIANNGTSTTQLFKGDVSGSPLILNPGLQTVTIPGGLPTGVVANGSSDFVVPNSGPAPTPTPGPARFIFDSQTGNISGWQANLGTTASIANAQAGNVYTGLAIGSNSGGNRLYAADFANGIRVFDGTYTPTTVTGGFIDPTIPTAMGNTYHPFNIQNLGGSLYVMYAKVNPMTGDEVAGLGNGFVRKFNTDGVRDLMFAINNGPLNAPWGAVIAPASFGIFGGALLIGNFGEGGASINAFNPSTGAFLGTLQNEAGVGIQIDELWGLIFGNGGNGGDPGTLYFTAGPADEEHGLFGSLKPTTASATSLIQFATDNFAVDEGGGHVDFTVVRNGDTSGTATVNFNTSDASQPGHASQKSDYEISLGKLTFNPGETSKTFRILLVDDQFVEGDETISLALSNPTGAGVGLGSPNVAEVTILDNDIAVSATNPIDGSSFFVRQHYLDFLNREPDAAGLAFWIDTIESCGSDAQCREVKRINASAAFFLSIEFQNTGFLVYLTHKAANTIPAGVTPPGVPVLFGTFERDTQALQKDFIFGQPGADAQLEANKVAFFNDFVTRPEFVGKYPATLTNAQYVDTLLADAGIAPSDFVVNLTNSQEVPPTNPTTTGGARRPNSFGTAHFVINAGETAMTMITTVNNIDITGSQTADTNDNLTNAHIHAGASVAPGVNGPVVWGFFGSPQNDNNPDDRVVTPSGVGGLFTGKWDTPEGNGTTLTAQLPNIRAGRAYINFHTSQFGGGEIRGNFPATQAFRDSLLNGLNAATETRATVLRKIAENQFFAATEFNRAFVLMQYYGYLRRDADDAGFAFWLKKLNEFGGSFINAEMVKAFISSSEYRQRFGS
ncbi:MAG TPA: TIGR03118 family protein [Pyrinomonadaceae bacterium]|nr:TIGR03118 family protein [Pyrinomonadaceae bacterium]